MEVDGTCVEQMKGSHRRQGPGARLFSFSSDPVFSRKLSTTITGPRRVVDYFDGLSLPVIAAFSTGPLKPYMFIIDVGPFSAIPR